MNPKLHISRTPTSIMSSAGYKPISSYGIIGDMHSAALVGLDGAIDWLCFPRFDSPSVFAALLDARRGGSFCLSPVSRSFPLSWPQTVEIIDFMPLEKGTRRCEHMVFRVVRGVSGQMLMNCRYQPRLDYARGTTRLTPCPGGVIAEKGKDRLVLASPLGLQVKPGEATAPTRVIGGSAWSRPVTCGGV